MAKVHFSKALGELVRIEQGSAHLVIHPPQALRTKARVRRMSENATGPDLAIQRAERAVQALAPQFRAWVEAMVQEASDAIRALAAAPSAAAQQRVFTAAHDLRGQAETFGYPVLGAMAASLAAVLAGGSPSGPRLALIERHGEAIRAVLRESPQGENDQLARALVAELTAAAARLDGGTSDAA